MAGTALRCRPLERGAHAPKGVPSAGGLRYSLAESDGTLGVWNDLLEESWHHTSEKSARLAIEDRYFPDITDVRKADVKRLVAIVSTKDRPSREAAEAVIAAAEQFKRRGAQPPEPPPPSTD